MTVRLLGFDRQQTPIIFAADQLQHNSITGHNRGVTLGNGKRAAPRRGSSCRRAGVESGPGFAGDTYKVLAVSTLCPFVLVAEFNRLPFALVQQADGPLISYFQLLSIEVASTASALISADTKGPTHWRRMYAVDHFSVGAL